MGKKVLGFENKIKFRHILARIFFFSHPHFKVTVLVSYPREDQQKAQHSVRNQGARREKGGGGQLPPPDFAGIEAKPSQPKCLGLLFPPPSRFSDLPTALHSVSWGLLCGPSQTAGPGKAGWCGS